MSNTRTVRSSGRYADQPGSPSVTKLTHAACMSFAIDCGAPVPVYPHAALDVEGVEHERDFERMACPEPAVARGRRPRELVDVRGCRIRADLRQPDRRNPEEPVAHHGGEAVTGGAVGVGVQHRRNVGEAVSFDRGGQRRRGHQVDDTAGHHEEAHLVGVRADQHPHVRTGTGADRLDR